MSEKEPTVSNWTDKIIRRDSPAEIELALWYYCRHEPHPKIPDNKTYSEIVQLYLDHGIFEKIEKSPWYSVTSKGKAWIEAICSTPFPVFKWEVPYDQLRKEW